MYRSIIAFGINTLKILLLSTLQVLNTEIHRPINYLQSKLVLKTSLQCLSTFHFILDVIPLHLTVGSLRYIN